MSSHGSLDSAAQERKARLAQLKSLKRKQPSVETSESADADTALIQPKSPSPEKTAAATILSGRNYDPETRGPKLGFEESPAENVVTLEQQATALAQQVRTQAQQEAEEDKPLDLFKLQPKKPNWDLKRELNKKLEILNTRTDNAIARLVRERIENAKQEKQKELQQRGKHNGGDEAEEVGMEGQALVEAMHVREREEEEEARREKEEENDMI